MFPEPIDSFSNLSCLESIHRQSHQLKPPQGFKQHRIRLLLATEKNVLNPEDLAKNLRLLFNLIS
uniref:Uncharacterized protein MANES_08G061400 n=1 Tax=Rhizophora mucronata TaxID=61149 RepID=A0A2P2KTS8_RHIMU